jgi:predicted AAA+ superfamily ATPase
VANASADRPVSRGTIESYISGLTEAFLIYPARRWDIKGTRLLESTEKYSVVDTGLRRVLFGDKPVTSWALSSCGSKGENRIKLSKLKKRMVDISNVTIYI